MTRSRYELMGPCMGVCHPRYRYEYGSYAFVPHVSLPPGGHITVPNGPDRMLDVRSRKQLAAINTSYEYGTYLQG